MSVRIDVGAVDQVLARNRTVMTIPESGTPSVLILRTRRGIFAVENSCPHAERRLSDASARGRRLTCSGHRGSFDLRSGRPTDATRSRLTRRPLRSFPAWVADGRLYIEV